MRKDLNSISSTCVQPARRVQVQVCTQHWGGGEQWVLRALWPAWFLRQDLFLANLELTSLARLAGQRTGICLCPPSNTRTTATCYHIWLLSGAEDLNSGPPASALSHLPGSKLGYYLLPSCSVPLGGWQACLRGCVMGTALEVEFQADGRPSATLGWRVGVGTMSEWVSICFGTSHKSFAGQGADRCQRVGILK